MRCVVLLAVEQGVVNNKNEDGVLYYKKKWDLCRLNCNIDIHRVLRYEPFWHI